MTKQSLFFAFICCLFTLSSGLMTPSRVPTRNLALKTTFLSAIAKTVEAPAVATPHQQRQRQQQQQQQKSYEDRTDDLWEVRVYNDNVNTHEWVAKCLVLVAGATELQAYQTTRVAHQEGDAFLGLYEKEVAEFYTEGLCQQGIIVQMFPVGDFQ